MATIPHTFIDLFQRSFGQLATLMPHGSPQVTPVWVDYDGRYILVNSARGRVKDQNMRRDPRVGMDIVDPDNPYRHLSIRGRVIEITEQGADEHIDRMAQSTSAWIATPAGSRVKYECFTRSNGRTATPWVESACAAGRS